MTTLIDVVQGNSHLHLGHSLRALADRAFHYVAEKHRQAEVLRELAHCDERDLHDIGITRGDFESVARGTFHR